MSWTAKLYPENDNIPPVTIREKVISYEIIPISSDSKKGRRKKYVVLNFKNGHKTILFDASDNSSVTVYRRLELYNRLGNMVVAHGNQFDPIVKEINYFSSHKASNLS